MINLESILNQESILNFDENWDLTKYVSSIIDKEEARKILIHILDIWDKINDNSKPIWLDLIERAGFYPYFIDRVKSKEVTFTLSTQSSIRSSFFKSDYIEGVYFHEKQKEIEIALSQGENVAVSAPTSFGKSLLIEEIVARKKFDNILIIQPTLALIDETRRKLKKYSDFYNFVLNTRQKPQSRNVFILTAERVLEFPNLPKINFFIIDEFYKISNRRNDSRIDALNVTLLKIMNVEPQAMFLTPTVDSLSKKFREKYHVNFIKTDYALVNTNIYEIRNRNGKTFESKIKKKKLFELLKEQTESTIVYVKSPNEAYKLAKEYLEYLGDNAEIINSNLDIYEWMDDNVSPNWQLKELLKYGIGAHNGALPRHIVSSEIDLFNSGVITILFATVSLIEGVNTVAKNMMIYSQNKGSNPIDFFDFANIRGRAGRMKQHYTGRVYLFIEEPEIEEFTIDVPAIDQDKVSDEILVNIPNSDVDDRQRKENLINGIDEELKEIMKKNLISFQGQKELYSFILSHFKTLDYLRWREVPTYEQLWQTLYLGYKYLKPNENCNEKFARNKALTALRLVNLPLKEVIKEQKKYYESQNKKDAENRAIDSIFNFQRRIAAFEIPKILTVIETIQKYVFQQKGIQGYGDYSVFATLLENEKVNERIQFLVDYGLPSSAIKKIDKIVDKNISGDNNILSYIRENKHYIQSNLLSYEKRLLLDAIEL